LEGKNKLNRSWDSSLDTIPWAVHLSGSDALPISNRDQNRKILEESPNGVLPQ
jgi:hypothetical protein